MHDAYPLKTFSTTDRADAESPLIIILVLLALVALGPVKPATSVVSDVMVAEVTRNLGGSSGSLAGSAVEDNVVGWEGLGEGVFLSYQRVRSQTPGHSLLTRWKSPAL
jgi:hypothetical protein